MHERPPSNPYRQHDRSDTTGATGARIPGVRSVGSADLFDGARELKIIHHGDTYCLRLTRNEKLILTK